MVTVARDYLRATGNEDAAVEFPSIVPPAVIVVGAEGNFGQLLRAPVREFGRRKSVLETNLCRDIKYNKTRPDTAT